MVSPVRSLMTLWAPSVPMPSARSSKNNTQSVAKTRLQIACAACQAGRILTKSKNELSDIGVSGAVVNTQSTMETRYLEKETR